MRFLVGCFVGLVLLASPAHADEIRVVSAPEIRSVSMRDVMRVASAATERVILRSQLRTELADFAQLATLLRGSFTPTGARIDLVAADSAFAAAGLRTGDLLVAVDDSPVRTLDDVANLYAQVPTASVATLQLVRAGAPVTLRVVIR